MVALPSMRLPLLLAAALLLPDDSLSFSISSGLALGRAGRSAQAGRGVISRRPAGLGLAMKAVPIPDELKDKKVLAVGLAGVDFIANVDSYPNADDKIRTTSLSVMGGGNAANTITAVRRLGVPAGLMTKLGEDGNAVIIKKELEGDGVDMSMAVQKAGLDSPFTYVMVDAETKSRTCIHTPIQEEIRVSEIPKGCLDGVSVLHCDARNTEAAIEVAKMANKKGVPVCIDVEKPRPFQDDLLPLADYVFTNTKYPQVFAPGKSMEDGIAALLEQGRAIQVVTTLGEKGSLLMRKAGTERAEPHPDITYGTHKGGKGEEYETIRCAASPAKKIVDTTGAGDSFIGGMIYGITTGMKMEDAMRLASYVAVTKCGGPGARAGLPLRQDIPKELLK